MRRRNRQVSSLTLSILGLVVVMAFGCVTRKASKSRPLTLKNQDPVLSMDNLAAGGPSNVQKRAKPGSTATLPKPTPRAVEKPTDRLTDKPEPNNDKPEPPPTKMLSCQDVVKRITGSYKSIAALRSPQNAGQTGDIQKRVLSYTASDCSDADKRRAVIKTMHELLDPSEGKVGLFVSQSGSDYRMSQAVIKGARAAFNESGDDFDKRVVVMDTGGNPAGAQRVLADFVLRERVALVIGGANQPEAVALASWADRLFLPMIVLTDKIPGVTSKLVFRSYPKESELATSLAKAAQSRSIKRIAILKPSDGKGAQFAAAFREEAKEKGIEIANELTFIRGDFNSMETCGKTVFKIDVTERHDEYEELLKQKAAEAEAKGQTFNPRFVFLKPVVDVQAILIPDDFKTVRHFAKIFKYLGVERMSLLGNQAWRSVALIDPPEPAMEGSIFTDFIGNYTLIPQALQVPTSRSPYFIEPQSVADVDFGIVAYRAGWAAAQSLKAPLKVRHRLTKNLIALRGESKSFWGPGPVFDKDRQTTWPSFVFIVDADRITLETGTVAH